MSVLGRNSLLLGMVAGLALVVAWLCRSGDVVPTPPGPNVPSDRRDPEPAVTSSIATEPDPVDESAPAARIQAETQFEPDDGIAFVEITVEQELGAVRTRLPFVEVMLQTTELELPARTDGNGMAAFEIGGRNGHRAHVLCGLGGDVAVTLDAAVPQRLTLTVRPRVLVRGKVVDASGTGIADASLVLLPWQGLGTDTPAPWRVGRSRSDGSFEVGLQVTGRLGAHHRVHGPSAMYMVRPGNGSDVAVVPLQLVLLSLPGQISGTVRERNGSPVAGAELEFRAVGEPPPGAELKAPPVRVRTDFDGAFLATRLCPGVVEYGVRAKGHGPLTGQVRVQPGQAVPLDLQLPSPARLVGTVRTATGPAAGAVVHVGTATAFASVRTNCDGKGHFELRDLPSGTTAVVARGTGASSGLVAETTLELHGGSSAEWHAVLGAPADEPNLHGTVADASGKPLPGCRVTTRVVGAKAASTTTADDGSFALLVPSGRRADLRVFLPHQPTNGFADLVRRDVDPTQGPVHLVVQPTGRCRVVGRIEDPDHVGVPAAVACWHHERAEHVRAQAAADGSVTLEVPAGTLDLLFEHPGFASHALRDVRIEPRQGLDFGTITLGSGGVLFGSVRGPDGMPPQECTLSLVTDGQRFHANYNAGTYRFPTVPVGAYSLLVQTEGASAAFQVTIEANGEKEQNVELRQGVPRKLRVRLPPAAGSSCGLVLRSPDRALAWLATGAVRDAAPGSTCEIEFTAYLPPGGYEAMAWGAQGHEARKSIRFVVGDDAEVLLELAPR